MDLSPLKTSKEVYLDGTFKSCPKLFYQIFSILMKFMSVYVPLVFCLLPDKQISTYASIFSLLRDYVPNVSIVYADLEYPLHEGARIAWPNIRIRACRFHLAQAWWRKIQNLGPTLQYKGKDSESGRGLKRNVSTWASCVAILGKKFWVTNLQMETNLETGTNMNFRRGNQYGNGNQGKCESIRALGNQFGSFRA